MTNLIYFFQIMAETQNITQCNCFSLANRTPSLDYAIQCSCVVGCRLKISRPNKAHVLHLIVHTVIDMLFYILATAKVISEWVLTCDGAHSWWLYSPAPLGNQTFSTMPWYPTQWHYPDAGPANPCPIVIMLSIWLGSDKFQFYKSLVWLDHRVEPTISRTWDLTLPIRPSCLVPTKVIHTKIILH